MRFDLITIFPDMLESYFSKGMIRIAQEKKLIKIKTHDLRQFAVDKHGTVDDRPYGGGPGQVLMVEPVYKALKHLSKKTLKHKNNKTKNAALDATRDDKTKIILLSARGKKWNQQMAQKFSKLDQIIFVCPRYEGHDERIRKFVDEEISIGDFILTGAELAAAIIIDSVTRLIPGVLGKQESLRDESHSKPGYLEYPQYTRPEVFEFKKDNEAYKHISTEAQITSLPPDHSPGYGWQAKLKTQIKSENKNSKFKTPVIPRGSSPSLLATKRKLRVPKVLLSGHHANIAEWRKKHENLNS